MKATISNTNLTRKSLTIAAGTSLFLILVLGFFVANFASPVFAIDTPFCTVTGDYSVCTDQADYTPSSIVHIAGSGFSPGNLLVKVTRADGSVVTGDGSFGNWPTAYDYVTVDSDGKLQFDYVLDGIEGQYLIEILDSENNILATHSFTDGTNKVGSVTVGSQSGTLTQGTAGSVNYTVTVNRGSGSSSSGSFTVDMNITTLLPSGATYSFSPNPVSFLSADNTKTSTLTITTTSATPAGTTTFTVKATRSDSASDFATGTGTLTINAAPTPPVITINNPDTSPAQSKTITASTDKGTLYQSVTTGTVCDGSLAFVSYSSITFTSESDNGKKVCYKAVDGSNTVYSMSNAIAGIDTTAPVITVTGTNPITIEVHASYVDVGATATDNVDSSVTVTSSGTVNVDVVGNYTIFYDAVDTAGNHAVQKSRIVHVVDTTKPVITLLGSTSVTIEIHSTYTDAGATAFDNYDGNLTSSIVTVNSVNKDVVGDYTVTYDVTDANGNSATQVVRTVHVVDTTLPVITLNGDNPLTIEVHTDYIESGAVITDNYDIGLIANITGTVNKDIVGNYTLYYDAIDSNGNHALQVTRTVNVVDTTPPVIDLHADVIAEATSSSGAIVSYTSPTASDNYDSIISVSCDPTSGSIFALGLTTVTCSATDSHSNAATPTTFNVTVQDTTPPVISNTPSDFSVEATSSAGAVATYSLPTANDLVDGSVTVICTPTSGSTFGLGENVVDCEATDAHSNNATSSFKITVVDTTSPTLNLPADITAEATGPSGTAVSYTATATDLVDGSVSVSCIPVSGSTFAIGTTSVNCSATDFHGNTATGSFNIIIEDTTAPVIAAHVDLTIEATSSAGATVTYTNPTATDNYDSIITVSCLPISGSTFGLGDTTVTCTATDAVGNDAIPTTFKVTVEDTTPPVVTVPADITLEATGPNTVVTYVPLPTATDLVDGSVIINCLPGSGSTFTLGSTTVFCSATDSNGNTATSTFNVIVQDTTAPTIDAATSIVAEATSSSGATVTIIPPTSHDAVDGDIPSSCDHSTGTFPIGVTTVTCTETDSNGNVAIPSVFTVTVQDTTSPTIDSHVDVVEEATGPSGAIVTYTSPATHDLVDGDGIATCNPASGSNFALGENPIGCEATDAHGNKATSSFKITIVDTTAPIITLNGDDPLTIEVHNDYIESGAVVTDNYDTGLTATITGTVDKDVVGTYTVNYDVTDSNGNSAIQVTRIVNVVDTTPPVITVIGGDETIEIHTPYTDVGATATDNYDASITVTSSGNVNVDLLGDYTITYNAVDSNGNSAVPKTRTVHVLDTVPPIISIVAPLKDSYLNGNVSIKISGSDSGSGIYKVEWSSDNSAWESTTFDGSLYVAIWDTIKVGDGIYTIYGRAFDNAGLVTYDPINVVVDNTPPVITVVSPTNTTYASSSVDFVFSVNEATSSVVYSLDGASNTTAINTTFSGLSNDQHNLTVYATDLAGNENSTTVLFKVSIPASPTNPTIPPTQGTDSFSGAPQATISSSNILTTKPAATSQVIVNNNGDAILFSPMIVVDSVCNEEIVPTYILMIRQNESKTFTVNFDCKGIPYGEYPITYTLQLRNGKIIASKTYTLKISEEGITAPNVVILATMSPNLSPGETGTVIVTLQNSGNSSTSGNVALNAPNGLSVTPSNIPIDLQPGDLKNVSFEVKVPTSIGTPNGLGILTGFASFFGVDTPSSAKLNVSVDYQTLNGVEKVNKAVEITITPRFPQLLIILSVGFVAAIAPIWFYNKRNKKV